MSEWKEYKLGDVAEITSSKRIFFSDYVDSGIPFYRSKEIIEKAKGENVSTNLFIPREKFNEIKEKFGAPSDGDILIAAVGERAGIPYCVRNDGEFYFKDGNLIWFRNFKRNISSDFLVYYFNSYVGQQALESTMIGSAQKALTIVGLKGLEVSFPPLPEQRAIASILSSLDDKIDLLHRQNKTLEQLAETLFKQWFVEEADMHMEEIPISEIADHMKVSINPSRFNKTNFFHYSIPAFDEGREPKLEIGKEILSNKYKVFSDSILISKLNPKTSRIWGLYGNIEEDRSICSTEFQIVKPKIRKWFGFTYCFLKSDQITKELASAVGGTSGSHQRVDPQVIFNLTFPNPNDEMLEKFDTITSEYWKRIKNNKIQIRTLKQLRDTLLPKLMSGEVTVDY